ncbi:hypothetical protein [Mycobacterium malmoense]|nr:hypothetical protein [Mycobacterium malmoense]
MNRSAFGRCIGLLRKRRPAAAVSDETPPAPSVELLWTGPGLGCVRGEGR